MVHAIATILLAQLAGELVARGLGLPLPGPVLGALFLVGLLAWRGGPGEGLEKAADGLLSNLSLLFVPAGVGVMLHAGLIGREWLAIAGALLVSTVLTVAVTGLVFRLLSRPPRGDAP